MSSQRESRVGLLEPAVYTAEEVAVILGLSKATVYAMANSGELPSKKAGRRILFPRRMIDAWLDSPDPVGAWHG